MTERDVEGHRLYREAGMVSALATPPAESAQGDQEGVGLGWPIKAGYLANIVSGGQDSEVQDPRQKVGLDIKPGVSTPIPGDAGSTFRAQQGEIP